MASIINATTTNGVAVQGDNSGSLQLQTNNGTTAVTIDTSQNVGIGTASPASKLDISTGSSTGTTDMITLSGLDNGSAKQTYGVIQMGIENNTASSEQGNILLQTVESGTVRTRININGSGYMAFSNGGTERMRITSGGMVGINNNNPSWLLTASNTGTSPRIAVEQTADTSCDMITFRRNGSERGKINVTDSATQYQTSSDYRLKENIKPLTNALETVAKLKPSSFTWIQERGGKEDNGFIAHELQEVLPNAVTGEKDAVDAEGNPVYQGVDTSFLVATLTAAIQELKAELDATKAEVQALKGVA